jgi:hypothetical protein
MDSQFTGLWTQRSPLRDADSTYLVRKFYSGIRFDSILDGINGEITSRLTSKRRPGTSLYNNAIAFSPVNSFYSYKYIQSGSEVVRVLADCTNGNIYDITGGAAVNLFTKSAGAGKTRFLGVGTELFFTDGVDLKKWVRSAIAWSAATTFTQGQFIVDTNLNLQLAIGSQQATITGVQIASNVVTLFFSSLTPLDIPDLTKLTLSGMTTVATLNGTHTVQSVENGSQITFNFTHANVAFSAETGSATTGTGTSGSTQPTWATTLGAITQDPSAGGGAQWECRGSAIQNWGVSAPVNAPTVTQAAAPTLYQQWAASTWYSPNFVIVDSNGNLQQLTTAGVTKSGGAPTWATTPVGATTADGTAVWTLLGSGAWAASTVYALNAIVQATFTYYITTPQITYVWNGYANVPVVTQVQTAVTVTCLFQCSQAGTSGTMTPSWVNGNGTTVTDGTVGWTNIGTPVNWPGAVQTLSLATSILDSNYNIQTPQVTGETGTTHPTWATAQGADTLETGPAIPQDWQNTGPYGQANEGSWTYAYSGKNSITEDISTASPASASITQGANKLVIIQGSGLADPQYDSLVIWRTAQGQATLLFLDEIPNPGAGQTWIYTDTTPDSGLDAEIAAPIAESNNPPPAGMTAPVYHQQRIWGIVNNTVVYSGGPDTLTGSGNTAFPPLNSIAFQEKCIRLWPITVSNGGLIVQTTSNHWIILGTGTASNPYYVSLYMPNVGILNYDAAAMLGTTLYFMENNGKVSSFDPSNGYVEIGFPIGDQLLKVTTGGISAALYNPATAFVTWNIQSSGETAMYVSDGAVGWFRFSPVSPPETGSLWSVRAGIVGGTSAVQSIETSPGVFNLLIGPSTSGAITMRDTTGTVWTDYNSGTATAYPFWDAKGVIRLCESGQIAEVAHVGLKSTNSGGARPVVSLLMDEIAPSTAVPWDVLQITGNDPPDVPPSYSMYSDRYVALQNNVTPKGDCVLLKVDYGSQAYADELLMYSIYGAKKEERIQR